MRGFIYNTCLLLLLSITQQSLLAQETSGENSPLVVSTIWPLQLIATAIVGEQGRSQAIIDSNDSAHHFSLTPDDRRLLEQADVVLWIDPVFEIQLAELIESESENKAVIQASALADVNLLQFSDRTLDPHLWLDPANGIAIANALADRLSELYPGNKSVYQQRAAELSRLLSSVQNDIERLGEAPAQPYFVYHNAFQYLEELAGISHAGSLVDDPDAEPSMREMITLRRRVDEVKPGCLLIEHEFSPALINAVIQEHELELISIDLLGYDQSSSSTAYVELLQALTANFRACVSAITP